MKYKGNIIIHKKVNIGPKFMFLSLTILLVVFYTSLLFSATIYIDPSNHASGQNGSISNPYDSWTDFQLLSGNTYLQKRGTTYTSPTQIYISAKNSIRIGSYSTGGRPVFSYTGSGYAFRIESSSNCTIEYFEVNGNGNAHSLVGIIGSSGNYTNGITINDCVLYNAHNTGNAGFGITGSYNNNLKILNTVIHNVALDGMYLANNPNIEIGYCNVYDINRRYFINPDQAFSSGDGIQMDGNYNGFHIHHTIIDRTNGAGNKFNLIFNSAPGTSDNATGILEYCTFKTGPGVSTAVHIERGNGIITRYNTFSGSTQGIRLGGAGTSNNSIHNNLFYDCSSGIGVGYSYNANIAPVGPCTNTKVYNNVFYHVTSKHIWVDQTYVQARNNIHMRTSDAGVAIYNYGGGSWAISNNCYSAAAVAGTPGTGTNPVIGNPLFINPATGNFNIQSNSPVINTGIFVGIAFDRDGTAIFQGTAPEIGAYEYLSSSGSNLPPVINNQSFSINENTANGTSVGSVIASDPNSGQILTYLITGGNTNNAFTINPSTGVLTVANGQSLNFESIYTFPLVIRVTDNGTGNLWAQATVSVNLININENPLIANQSFSVAQNASNGTIAGTVVASDPDQSQILSYSITAGNTNNAFAINPSTGRITVISSSAVVQGSFYLIVRATDNGNPILWSAATITITVTPATNLAPVIAAQSFSAVQYASNGTFVGTIIASDPNSGQTLTYSITAGNTNSAFAINATNGNLTIANSAALIPGVFSLTVRVTDNGNPALFSQATITVNITTPPNQAPVIVAQSFSIIQFSPNGTLVGTIIASDPNSGQTLTYSITAGNTNSAFAINAANGNLTIANSPALSPGVFSLTVRVTDNGNPCLYSQATVTINVSTPPNQAPVILNQVFSAAQNATNGTFVGIIVASDPNPGQTLTWSIITGNTNSAFAINSSNGNLTVNNSSALTLPVFALVIRVTDNGSPSLWSQATITVNITQQSNQSPVIANQSFGTAQYSPTGTLVGVVVASDPNAGQTLTYSLIAGNTGSAFGINSANGNLAIANSSSLIPGTFSLTIRVCDNGIPSMWSQALITITVIQSVNAPLVLNQKFFTVQNHPEGMIIGNIEATSQIDGHLLNYYFHENSISSGFKLNPNTGAITIDDNQNLEVGSNLIIVRVSDTSNPDLSAEAEITIIVTENSIENIATLNNDSPATISDLDVLVYPNPSRDGIFRLNLKGILSTHTDIQVFDLSGRIITSFATESFNDIVVDLSSQPKGSYILKVFNQGLSKTTKAIIN